MDDRVDAVALDGVGDRSRVSYVTPDQRDVTDGRGMAEFHGIERHDVASLLLQEAHRVGTDVAGAACHEDRHLISLADSALDEMHTMPAALSTGSNRRRP